MNKSAIDIGALTAIVVFLTALVNFIREIMSPRSPVSGRDYHSYPQAQNYSISFTNYDNQRNAQSSISRIRKILFALSFLIASSILLYFTVPLAITQARNIFEWLNDKNDYLMLNLIFYLISTSSALFAGIIFILTNPRAFILTPISFLGAAVFYFYAKDNSTKLNQLFLEYADQTIELRKYNFLGCFENNFYLSSLAFLIILITVYSIKNNFEK